VGGVGRDRSNTGALEVFDPAANRWESRPPMPTPRDHHAAAAVDGKLYVIGGRLGGNYSRNLDAHELYEPARNAWSARPPLPTPRSGIGAAVVGSRFFVFGGEGPNGTFGEVEAIDAGAGRWTAFARMPTPRHGLAVVAHGGRIYVISGGPRPGGSFSSANEVFTP
jgi:N-acetylneuraminic acid mutarotase